MTIRRDLTLLAAGREADIYALDHDRVLRRFRRPEHGDPAAEAKIMAYVADHGYPVPRVHDTTATDLVLDRLHGPTLFETWERRPWTYARNAAILAELHDRLAAIPAPDWLPPPRRPTREDRAAPGGSVLHLDLHPLNVIMTPDRGPVVIDWTNASAGDPAFDLARTLVTIGTADIPGNRARALRRPYLRALRRHAGTDPGPQMIAAARDKLTEPHNTPREAFRLRAILRRSLEKPTGGNPPGPAG